LDRQQIELWMRYTVQAVRKGRRKPETFLIETTVPVGVQMRAADEAHEVLSILVTTSWQKNHTRRVIDGVLCDKDMHRTHANGAMEIPGLGDNVGVEVDFLPLDIDTIISSTRDEMEVKARSFAAASMFYVGRDLFVRAAMPLLRLHYDPINQSADIRFDSDRGFAFAADRLRELKRFGSEHGVKWRERTSVSEVHFLRGDEAWLARSGEARASALNASVQYLHITTQALPDAGVVMMKSIQRMAELRDGLKNEREDCIEGLVDEMRRSAACNFYLPRGASRQIDRLTKLRAMTEAALLLARDTQALAPDVDEAMAGLRL